MLKNYRFGFDIWGLIVFLAVMLPSFIWYAVPAPVDVLRAESNTPVIDTIGSVLQVLFITCLCFLINKDREKLHFSLPIILMIACILLYYLGWILYYCGMTSPLVILLMTVPPCAAFIFFAIDRKNLPAILLSSGFAICHLLFAIINFI